MKRFIAPLCGLALVFVSAAFVYCRLKARSSAVSSVKVVSVKDFGAVGDGKSDDAAAFQAACDSGSDRVVIPRGVYNLPDAIRITSSVAISACKGAEMLCNPEKCAIRIDSACKDVVIEGGVWKNGVFLLKTVRGLRVCGVTAERIRILCVDGFEVENVTAGRVDVGGCSHCGRITGCNFAEGLSLRDDAGDVNAAGPVDELTVASVETPRVFMESKRSTMRAISIDAPGAESVVAPGTDAYCDEVFFNGSALDGPHKSRGKPVRFKSRVLADPGLFEVTSPFGRRTHPVTGETDSFHGGVDGALWNGRMLVETMILSCDDGVVLDAEESDGPAGTFVAIGHPDGIVSKYFHLERGSLRVGKGDAVEAGTPLGRMGRSGRATGEHLHFQIEKDGTPVDPVPWLLVR